jgi:uncharacterized protein with von Willebrand factor type A (vWA) domain
MKILNLISILSSLILLSSCGNFTLKKSAGNKYFDTSGFEGSKRRPLYNKKYITMAKKNVVEFGYDEEENETEIVDLEKKNIKIYKDMLDNKEEQKSRQSKGLFKFSKYEKNSDIKNLNTARNEISKLDDSESENKLSKEIAEIKELLAKTKLELEEMKKERVTSNVTKSKTKLDIKKEIDEELKSVTGNPKPKKIAKKKPVKKAAHAKPKPTIEPRRLDSPKAAL